MQRDDDEGGVAAAPRESVRDRVMQREESREITPDKRLKSIMTSLSKALCHASCQLPV
jgi:hypothetical protein